MDIKEMLLSENVIMTINQNMDLLLNYIPEIESMVGFDQRHPHHSFDLWNHTLLSLYIAEINFIQDYDVRLSLLLHDIGKPSSFIDGKVRHYCNHAYFSYEIAKCILDRFDYSNEFKDNVLYLIKNHDNAMSNELIVSNPELAKKLYDVQYCDSLAHNPKFLKKRIRYLENTKIRMLTKGKIIN